MRSHPVNQVSQQSRKRIASGLPRRLRQSAVIALLAVLSVGCALSNSTALPPLPQVALLVLEASRVLAAASAGAPYMETLTTVGGVPPLTSCQFLDPSITSPVTMTGTAVPGVPAGITIAPSGTTCVLGGTLDPTVQSGTYTFRVRASDNSAPALTDTETYTINVNAITVSVTSIVASPSVTGETVTVNYQISFLGPNPSAGNLTATVTGGLACSGINLNIVSPPNPGAVPPIPGVATGDCTITFPTSGAKTIMFSYSDPAYPATVANPTTTTANHTVNAAATTLTVTPPAGATVAGQSYTVNFTVAAVAPGALVAPTMFTGTVLISDGLDTCTGNVTGPGTGNCILTSTTNGGPKTLSGTYTPMAGDNNFLGSMGSAPHTVNMATTTTTVTPVPTPSVTGETITANVTVATNAPGMGEPTGTVPVDDGTGAMCTVTLTPGAAGSNMSAGSCTLTPTTAGNKTLTAVYSGDANFATSTDTQAHTVNPAATTTTITSDTPDPSITGQAYMVNVTVDTNAPGTGRATGTVNVLDGQGQTCMVALAPGPGANQSSGSCMITSITTAVTLLTANYITDGNYAASSDTEAHTVNLAPTATTITSDTPDPSSVGQAITVNFTVASVPPGSGEPTGTVTVDDGFGQMCVGPLTPGAPGSNMSTGTCMVTAMNISVTTLTANYSGDANFAMSSDTEPHVMTAGGTTTTITADAPDPSVTGQAFTVNVTVDVVAPATGNPTGVVTIADGLGGSCMATLAAGPGANQSSGSCPIMSTTTAVMTLTATYPGDTNFGGSMDTEPHTVSPSPTTTVITSDTPDPSVTGESITVNVTVAPTGGGLGEPTGTVTISDGTAVCMAALVPGAPGSNMSTGSCSFASDAGTAPGINKTLTANYGGDANFAVSAGNAGHTTNRANTTTVVTAPAAATVSGEPYLVNVTVMSNPPGAGSPLGNVTIDDGEGNNCLAALMASGVNMSSGSCMLTSQSNGVPGKTLTGNFPLTASYNGSVDTDAHTVNPASTTTLLMSSVNPSVFGEQVTFTATVSANAPGSGTPTGTVDFVDTTTATTICTAAALAGGTATCMVSNLVVGAHLVRADYVGDPDFTASMSALFVQTVNQASSAITVLSKSVDPTVTGQPYTVNVTVSAVAPGMGEPTGTVTVDDGDGVACMAALTPGAPGSNMSTGSCMITSQSNGVPAKTLSASYPGDTNFLNAANMVAHTVNPATTTTTITSDAPDPSDITTAYTVNVTVMTTAPGMGEPTGSVTVDDGSGTATTCLALLVAGAPGSNMSTGSCLLLTTVRSPMAGFTLAATYNGDPDFAVSVGNDQHVVTGIASTTTITADVPDPTIFGEPYTVSVQVVSASLLFTPSGTVTVDDGIGGTCVAAIAGALGTSTGSCMIASMPAVTPVTLNLTATYPGDPTFEPSASGGADTHDVNQAMTTTTITSDAPDPSLTGEAYTVNVTVAPVAPATGAPTGTVTIDDGDGNSCMAALVGGVNQSTGSCQIASTIAPSGAVKVLTANYPGDATFSGSMTTDGHTVNQGNTTVTVATNSTSSGAGASVSGEQFDVDVTVAATNPAMGEPTGSVDVNDGLGGICTIAVLTPGAPGSNTSTGTCQLTLVVAGSPNRTITATYNGDTEFAAGGTGNAAHTVNPSPTTTTLIANGDVNTVTGEQYTVMVTVTSSGGGMGEPDGDVDVDDGEGNTCNTGALTPGAPGSNMSTGSCMLTSSANAPNQLKTIAGNYNPGGSAEFATSTGTDPHTVNEAATTTTVTNKSIDPSVTGEDYDVTVTVTTNAPGTGEPTGMVTVQDDDATPTDSCVATLVPGAPGSNTSTGTCTVLNSRSAGNTTDNLTASYATDGNFAASMSAAFPHTVNKAGTGFPVSPTKMPDPSTAGQAYTVSASVNGAVAGGEGQPTGTVFVDDGFGGTCTIILSPGPGANESSGSCMITSTTTATNNLDFTYSGDNDFNGVMTSLAHTVVMGILTTPAAPGGVMGDGVDGRAIGGGTAGVDGVAFEVVGASGGVANCVFGGTTPTGVVVAPGMTSGAADACVMSGAPTQTGTFMFTITVTDGAANMATTTTITWDVQASLMITSSAAPGAAVDQRNYTFMLTASGGIGVKTFDNNGTALATQDVDCTSFAIAADGSFTATPAALQAGDDICAPTLRVQDMASTSTAAGSATQALSVPINAALNVTPTTIPNGRRQAVYNPTGPGFVVTATGGTGISLMWTPSANFTLTAGNWVGNIATPCEGLQFPQAPGGNTTTITGVPVNAGTLPGSFSATCSFTMQADDASNGPSAGGSGMTAYSPIIFNTLAFAAGTGTSTIEVVNTDTNAFVSSIGSLNATPDQVAVSPDGRYVFATSPTSDEIVVVDVTTGAPVGNSPFDVNASCNGPLGLASTLTAAGGRRIFVACSVNAGGTADERVVTYDFNPTGGAGGNGALTATATADFTGGGGEDHDPQRVAITPDGSTVFVVFVSSVAAGGEWGRVNATTGAIIQNGGNDFTNFSPACGTPTGIAIAQTAQAGNPVEAYVACTGPNEIAILNTATLAQAAANISVGSNPNSVEFIPGANAARAYVSLNGADQIAVVDTAARTATNLNLPSPNAAADADSNPLGVTIPVPPNNAPTVEVFTSLSGAAAPSPGVNVIADPATVASAGVTISTTAASAPRGIAHIPRPRQ